MAPPRTPSPEDQERLARIVGRINFFLGEEERKKLVTQADLERIQLRQVAFEDIVAAGMVPGTAEFDTAMTRAGYPPEEEEEAPPAPWDESIAEELVSEVVNRITAQFPTIDDAGRIAVREYVLDNLLLEGPRGAGGLVVPRVGVLPPQLQAVADEELRATGTFIENNPDAPTFTVQYGFMIDAAAAENPERFTPDLVFALKNPAFAQPNQLPFVAEFATAAFQNRDRILDTSETKPGDFQTSMRRVIQDITPETINPLLPVREDPSIGRRAERGDALLEAFGGDKKITSQTIQDFYGSQGFLVDMDDPDDKEFIDSTAAQLEVRRLSAIAANPGADIATIANPIIDELEAINAQQGVQDAQTARLREERSEEGQEAFKASQDDEKALALANQFLFDMELSRDDFSDENFNLLVRKVRDFGGNFTAFEQFVNANPLLQSTPEQRKAEADVVTRRELSQTAAGANTQRKNLFQRLSAHFGIQLTDDLFRAEDIAAINSKITEFEGDPAKVVEWAVPRIPGFLNAKETQTFVEGGTDSVEQLLQSMGIGIAGSQDAFQQALRAGAIPQIQQAFAERAFADPFGADARSFTEGVFEQAGFTPGGQLRPFTEAQQEELQELQAFQGATTPEEDIRRLQRGEEPAFLDPLRQETLERFADPTQGKEIFEERLAPTSPTIGGISSTPAFGDPAEQLTPLQLSVLQSRGIVGSGVRAGDQELSDILGSMATSREEFDFLLDAFREPAGISPSVATTQAGIAFQDPWTYRHYPLQRESGGGVPGLAALQRASRSSIPTLGTALATAARNPREAAFLATQVPSLREGFEAAGAKNLASERPGFNDPRMFVARELPRLRRAFMESPGERAFQDIRQRRELTRRGGTRTVRRRAFA